MLMGSSNKIPMKCCCCFSFSIVVLLLSSHCYVLIKAEEHAYASGIRREITVDVQARARAQAQAHQQQQGIQNQHYHHTHTLQLTSLLSPPDSCNPSPKGDKKLGNSLEVRHRHGPCSPLNTDKSSGPTHAEILEADQARVESIKARVKPKLTMVNTDRIGHKKAVGLPAKSGSTIGSGNFIVTLGLGTPRKDLSLIFDTGSDFTWTQCAPCSKSCYKQKEAVFDPSASSTYSNITCSSSLCSDVRSATSTDPGCTASTCVYGIQYGDSSFSVGFFAKDTLSLGSSSSDTLPNFLFGCGENNQGLFGGSAGLFGLGRNKLSAVSQTASKYGSYFSYCLPSKSTSTGHLTFGKGGTYSKGIRYTSLLSSSQGPSFYFIELQDIGVGGKKLSISPSVFSTAGTVIDSGTVITRLPPDAYSALQSGFSKAMAKYPKAPALSILDTCYDFSNYSTVTVPKVSLFFGGGAEVDLQLPGILYVNNLSQVCLAFAANEEATDVGILGNVQQLTFDVVYDVSAGKLGFAPGGCA